MIANAAPAQLGDVVAANIDGTCIADIVLREIASGTNGPDALHAAAMKAWGEFGSPGLAGFHRRICKRLEGAR